MKRSIVPLVLAIALPACLNDVDRNGNLEAGVYDFRTYNEDGSPYVSGTITIQLDADGKVTGAWEIEGMNGDGKLEGTLKDDVMMLNFHPGWADHNFLVQGTVDGSVIRGGWQWIGFPGVMSEGTFEAERT